MKKKDWLKWILYLIIVLLALAVLKTLVSRLRFSANYLVSIVLLCLQTLVVLGFIYYAILAILIKRRISSKRFITFFLTSFVAIVSGLEIMFTYWLNHPDKIPAELKWSYKYYYEVYNFHLMQYEKKIISLDKELLYTLKPGILTDFHNVEFDTKVKTNKIGVRDDENSLKSPEIICLGDSFTLGWGVEKDQSFPEIIEKETGKKVLNAGIPSYGTARELMLFNRLDTSGLKYLIIQYCSNDEQENDSYIDHGYKLELTPFSEYESAMSSYEYSRKYFPAKNFLLITQLWLKQAINKIYPFFTLNGQQYTGVFNSQQHAMSFWKIFERFSKKFPGIKIIVTDLEPYVYHDNGFIAELNDMLHESQKRGEMKNVVFINSINELTPRDYFILDHHINVSGHQKVASKLLKEIEN